MLQVRSSLFFFLMVIGCTGANTSPAPLFGITTLTKNSILVKRGYSKSEFDVNFFGEGKIKNLSDKTLDRYALKLTFLLYNEKGESYSLKDIITLAPDHGFGYAWRARVPWKPNEEINFKIKRYLSVEDMLYPITSAKVRVKINASDPFGFNIEQKVAFIDITEEWLAAQRKLDKYNVKESLRKNQ